MQRAQVLYEKAQGTIEIANQTELLQQAALLLSFGHNNRGQSSPASWRLAVNIHYTLGRIFYQQAKWQLAITHFEKAFAVDSIFGESTSTSKDDLKNSLAQAYHSVAQQLMKRGKTSAALHSARKAVHRDSTFLPAYLALGLAHFHQGEYDAAIAAYHRVMPTHPSVELYNSLGAAYEAKGHLAEAIAAYRHVLEMDSQLPLAQDNLQRAQEKFAQVNPPAENKLTASTIAFESNAAADSIGDEKKKRNASVVITKTSPVVSSKISASKEQKKEKPRAAAIIRPASKEILHAKRPEPPSPTTPQTLVPSIDTVGTNASHSASPLPLVSKQQLAAEMVSANSTPLVKLKLKPAGRWWVVAFITGLIGVGVFIFVYRGRRDPVWPSFKSSSASSKAEENWPRHFPFAQTPRPAEAFDESRVETELPAKAEGELISQDAPTDNLPSAATEVNGERQSPALQTQNFFAEIIAGEPEVDAFGEIAAEKPTPDANQRNEDIDHSSVLQSLFPSSNELAANGGAPDSAEMPIAAMNNGVSPSPIEVFIPGLENKIPHQNATLLETGNGEQTISNTSLGRYLIEREIGSGAMGKIYLAWDPKLERRVVIKTMCFDLAAGDTKIAILKDRVYREARAIAKLMHPNIVVVYDVEDNENLSYIVMEHIEGRDLKQALRAGRCFDYQRAINIVSQVCSALDYAHRAGIFHCDVKPSNIMLLAEDKAKITDFGIAKIADHFSPALSAQVLGTPYYMAPEQFDGEEIDGRADIFSLGVVLYELLTGKRPFAGDSVATLAYKISHKMPIPPSLQNVELPMEFDEIVGRAIAKAPGERYQTAEEFREALLGVTVEVAI